MNNAQTSLHDTHMRRLIAFGTLAIFGVIALGSVIFMDRRGVLFSSGVFYYQLYPLIGTVIPFQLAHGLLWLSSAIGTIFLFLFLQRSFVKNYIHALVLSAFYTLAPFFYLNFLPIHFFLLAIVGIPVFLYLATHSRRRPVQLLYVWIVLSMFVTPIAGLFYGTLLLVIHHAVPEVAATRKHKGIVAHLFLFVVSLLIGLLSHTYLGNHIAHYLFPTYVPPAYATSFFSTDLNWLTFFPLAGFFDLYLPSSIAIKKSAFSWIIFPLFAVVAVFASQLLSKQDRKPWLIYFVTLIVSGIFSLGPFLKIAGEIPNPIVTMPWILLYFYDAFGRLPYAIVSIMLVSAVCMAAIYLRGIRPQNQKHASALLFAAFAILIGQYLIRDLPVTKIYVPTGYDKITAAPQETRILENFDNTLLNYPYSNMRRAIHKQDVLQMHNASNELIYRVVSYSGLPLITQNEPGDYNSLLLKHNIHYIDHFKQKMYIMQPDFNEVNQESVMEGVTKSELIDRGINAEKIYGDDIHDLYKLRYAPSISGLLAVSHIGKESDWAEKEDHSALKLQDIMHLHYFNNTKSGKHKVKVKMTYRTSKGAKVQIDVPEKEKDVKKNPEAGQSGVIEFTTGKLLPGQHEIEVRVKSGSIKFENIEYTVYK